MPHGFMTHSTATPSYSSHRRTPCKQSRHPIAMLQKRVRRFYNCRVLFEDPHDLCPEPFRRIDPTFISCEVDSSPILCDLIDTCRFFHCSMIFPENEHCTGVIGILRLHGERYCMFIDSTRGRASCIDGYTSYAFSIISAHLR